MGFYSDRRTAFPFNWPALPVRMLAHSEDGIRTVLS